LLHFLTPSSPVLPTIMPPSIKRKKMSGLTGLELRMAYKSLTDVQSSLKTVTATNETITCKRT
jgi:hypothetical protein